MTKNTSYKKYAAGIATFLLLLCLCSTLWLMLPPEKENCYTADLYQNGILIMSIPLDGSTEGRTFTIEGKNGCVNEIQIRSGGIGILSADCPDKLCVKQGFIRDARIPITCLPNRLVIQLRPPDKADSGAQAPDILTY